MQYAIIRRRSAIRSLIRRCRAHGASALAIVDRDAIACLWAFRNA
jgi:DNA polymerase III alpha subunit